MFICVRMSAAPCLLGQKLKVNRISPLAVNSSDGALRLALVEIRLLHQFPLLKIMFQLSGSCTQTSAPHTQIMKIRFRRTAHAQITYTIVRYCSFYNSFSFFLSLKRVQFCRYLTQTARSRWLDARLFHKVFVTLKKMSVQFFYSSF